MIERVHDALVAYVNDEMEPVAKAQATLWKVRYDDGRIVFFRPLPPGTNPAAASSSLVVGAPVAKGFPDQPRDDHGRFGETGWTRESTGAPPSAPAGEMARGPGPEYQQALEQVGQDLPSLTPYDTAAVRGARAMQAAIPQTADIATPERAALREQVANRIYGTGAATKGREAWIVLGPPAAGKSTVLAGPIAQQRGALVIDSDSAKPLIPEFANGNGASAVHQESSDIVNGIVLARAMRAGDNVVLPLVGKTPTNITAIADRLQEQGYRVHALLNDLPPEQAAQRAVTRFEQTGRFVDPNYVLNEVGTNPRRSYAALKTHAAVVDYAAYSNDVPKGQPPRLLESGSAAPRPARGRGGRGADSPNPRKPRFLDEVGDAVGQLAADIFPDWMSPDLLQAAHPDGLRVLKQQAVLPMSDLKGVGKHHIRVLLVDATGRLLLLHWAKGSYRPADWAPVQGHVGDDVPDETPRQAAEREVLEETGYGGGRLVWHVLYPNCWVVQLPPGISTVPVLSEEHNAYRWLSPTDTAQWLAREGFYGQWAASLKRARLVKQGPADPHLAALIVHGAQLDDWLPLAQAIAGDLGEAGAESTVQAFDALGVDDRGAFRVANTAASDWARHRAAILVRNVEERTRAGLRDIVTTALEEGWSPDELSSAITEDYLFSPERADLIATTELALAHSSGTLATWRATGQVAGKRNVLSPTHTDVDECDDNTAVGVIPLNEPFPSGDDGPPYHPRCLVGTTRVAAVGVTAQTARRYHGELIIIGLAAQHLAVTPNHPILTARGWVAAGALQLTDLLVQCPDPTILATLDPDNDYVQAMVQDFANAAWMSQAVATRHMPQTPKDFHGDGTVDEEVYIVGPNGGLGVDWTEAPQFDQHTLLGARQWRRTAGDSLGPTALLGVGHPAATDGCVRRRRSLRSLRRSLATGVQAADLAERAHREPQAMEPGADRRAVASDLPSEIHARLTGHIALIQPTYLDRCQDWEGQVYNLSTKLGWYCAEGIITHNCRCVVVPELLDAADAEKYWRTRDLAKYAPDQLRDPEGRFAYEGAGKQYTPKGNFAILTAANPGGQNQSAAANAKANQRLARDLRGRGYNPVAVTGHYTDTTSGQTLSEPSFLVSGVDAPTAVGLGGKYEQNSVITHQGLHDIQHHTLALADGFVAQPQDAYTQLPGGRKLTLSLNPQRSPIPDFASGLPADWAERQMQGDTARLAEEDVAFDYISGPALEHQATAAEVLDRLGSRFPVKKKVGPHWHIAIEFPPEAWRVMRSLHLKRKRTKE